jgi:hypothetical protein
LYKPTAIVVGIDEDCGPVYRALHRKGVAIPDDCSRSISLFTRYAAQWKSPMDTRVWYHPRFSQKSRDLCDLEEHSSVIFSGTFKNRYGHRLIGLLPLFITSINNYDFYNVLLRLSSSAISRTARMLSS